jgi:hypothetical protein
MQFSGGRGDLPLIDTLLILPILGIAVSFIYLLICKNPKNLKKIAKAHSDVWTVDREVWTLGDPSYREPPSDVECQYCGTLYSRGLSKCPTCYAPRRMKS